MIELVGIGIVLAIALFILWRPSKRDPLLKAGSFGRIIPRIVSSGRDDTAELDLSPLNEKRKARRN